MVPPLDPPPCPAGQWAIYIETSLNLIHNIALLGFKISIGGVSNRGGRSPLFGRFGGGILKGGGIETPALKLILLVTFLFSDRKVMRRRHNNVTEYCQASLTKRSFADAQDDNRG